jgi:hypothetical protein
MHSAPSHQQQQTPASTDRHHQRLGQIPSLLSQTAAGPGPGCSPVPGPHCWPEGLALGQGKSQACRTLQVHLGPQNPVHHPTLLLPHCVG